jgi:hypothetical protein
MSPKTPMILTLVLSALTLPGAGHAQGPAANLGLRQSGEPRGYAFLMQVLPYERTPEVQIQLRPEPTYVPPSDWTWTVVDPSDNALKLALSFKWYAQASCPDALTQLKVSGPGGTLTQNPLWNPIWGYFNTQSFTLDTVKNICIDWATANNCDPTEPGCQLVETFDLVGGVAPAAAADRLHLKASCASGPVADTFYAPVMRLRCDRGSY